MSINLKNGFVLHPDRYYLPSYRISPFSTADLRLNRGLELSGKAEVYFNRRFGEGKWRFTSTGKHAINLALSTLNLKPSDCITVLTTSGNRYISVCVTKEIEKFCRWSRQMEKETKAVFVNHEFGYPYRDLDRVKAYGLPVIEDACHSFLADTPSQDMGSGDFTLFSLPKMFPVQMGGVLAFHTKGTVPDNKDGELHDYLVKVVSRYVDDLPGDRVRRLRNYESLANKFSDLGCAPRFELLNHDVPGVFMFKVPSGVDLAAMKEYGWAHGIECSVFYGEEAFFIPCHQRLDELDLEYFRTVFGDFLTKRIPA